MTGELHAISLKRRKETIYIPHTHPDSILTHP